MRQRRGCSGNHAGSAPQSYAEVDPALKSIPTLTRAGRNTLALPGLEAALRLVDDIDAALAAHDAIVAVTAAQ
jgi:hypothetical protein